MAASWVNEVDDALWEKWKARQLDPPLVVDPPLVAMVLPRKSDRIRVFPNEALATFNAHEEYRWRDKSKDGFECLNQVNRAQRAKPPTDTTRSRSFRH